MKRRKERLTSILMLLLLLSALAVANRSDVNIMSGMDVFTGSLVNFSNSPVIVENITVEKQINITNSNCVGECTLLSLDSGIGTSIINIDGDGGACLQLRDSDNAGWTYCIVLNGVMTCNATSC